MTQTSLDREVAKATGERLSTIRRMGFHVERPPLTLFDPDSKDDRLSSEPATVDWDELAAGRLSIFPCRYDRSAA